MVKGRVIVGVLLIVVALLLVVLLSNENSISGDVLKAPDERESKYSNEESGGSGGATYPQAPGLDYPTSAPLNPVSYCNNPVNIVPAVVNDIVHHAVFGRTLAYFIPGSNRLTFYDAGPDMSFGTPDDIGTIQIPALIFNEEITDIKMSSPEILFTVNITPGGSQTNLMIYSVGADGIAGINPATGLNDDLGPSIVATSSLVGTTTSSYDHLSTDVGGLVTYIERPPGIPIQFPCPGCIVFSCSSIPTSGSCWTSSPSVIVSNLPFIWFGGKYLGTGSTDLPELFFGKELTSTSIVYDDVNTNQFGVFYNTPLANLPEYVVDVSYPFLLKQESPGRLKLGLSVNNNFLWDVSPSSIPVFGTNFVDTDGVISPDVSLIAWIRQEGTAWPWTYRYVVSEFSNILFSSEVNIDIDFINYNNWGTITTPSVYGNTVVVTDQNGIHATECYFL
jgi:hypothetical protein